MQINIRKEMLQNQHSELAHERNLSIIMNQINNNSLILIIIIPSLCKKSSTYKIPLHFLPSPHYRYTITIDGVRIE